MVARNQIAVWNFFGKPLPVGSAAPEFEALDESGRLVRLSSLRGHAVLLVFYPADGTPVCRAQLCEIRDSWSQFEAAGVRVFGVNPARADRHRRFSADNRFPFPLLVDQGQRIAKLYRANGWLVKRTVVLIDAVGTIVFSQRGAPSSESILRALHPLPKHVSNAVEPPATV